MAAWQHQTAAIGPRTPKWRCIYVKDHPLQQHWKKIWPTASKLGPKGHAYMRRAAAIYDDTGHRQRSGARLASVFRLKRRMEHVSCPLMTAPLAPRLAILFVAPGIIIPRTLTVCQRDFAPPNTTLSWAPPWTEGRWLALHRGVAYERSNCSRKALSSPSSAHHGPTSSADTLPRPFAATLAGCTAAQPSSHRPRRVVTALLRGAGRPSVACRKLSCRRRRRR